MPSKSLKFKIETVFDSAELKAAWPLTRGDLVIVARVVAGELSAQHIARCEQLLGQHLNKTMTVSLRLCDDPEIRILNKRYRKLDRATDVLSFSALEQGQIDHFGFELGDVVISVDTTRRASLRHKRPFKDECLEVLVHGLLHIFGFDHVGTLSEAKLMRGLQRRLFLKARAVIRSR